MLVRVAKESDVLFLKRLLAQLGYPDMAESDIQYKVFRHQQEGYRLLVAETDQEVIAFISLHWFDSFHFAGNIGRISAFCVDEQFRSQGIGTTLLHAAEVFFKENACTKMEVTSNERRTLTHQFYLKRGFTVDSKRFVKYLTS